MAPWTLLPTDTRQAWRDVLTSAIRLAVLAGFPCREWRGAAHRLSLEADNQASAFQQRLLQAAQGYRLTLEDTVKVAAGLNDKARTDANNGVSRALIGISAIIAVGLLRRFYRVPS